MGAAVVFNPTEQTLEFVLVLPLYYCGLDVDALVAVNGEAPVTMTLNRDYTVHHILNMRCVKSFAFTLVNGFL